jgi:ATP-dependent DNA helicase RecG
VYDGASKLEQSRVFQPGVNGYAVGFSGLIDFINAQIPSNEIIGKAFRIDFKMFGNVSVRELVANALIHQDFNEVGTSVTVEIYSDRLEVSNPGTPIISAERFIDEYQSRNERLADLMRRMGVSARNRERGSTKLSRMQNSINFPRLIFVLVSGTQLP